MKWAEGKLTQNQKLPPKKKDLWRGKNIQKIYSETLLKSQKKNPIQKIING